MSISAFRLGNYALFDGELQVIKTQHGLESSAFLDPVPISVQLFKDLGIKELEETREYSIYLFKTGHKSGISVVFNSRFESEFLIMEQYTRVEFPFVRWFHELQNLVSDRQSRPGDKSSNKALRRTIDVL